mmetsp:Transcript_85894/g.277374  ORF Transcript_85894/g.277374 Transcript_85894/m.277374 type:complete len:245 (+) Transcript_85894:320-1054(+)
MHGPADGSDKLRGTPQRRRRRPRAGSGDVAGAGAEMPRRARRVRLLRQWRVGPPDARRLRRGGPRRLRCGGPGRLRLRLLRHHCPRHHLRAHHLRMVPHAQRYDNWADRGLTPGRPRRGRCKGCAADDATWSASGLWRRTSVLQPGCGWSCPGRVDARSRRHRRKAHRRHRPGGHRRRRRRHRRRQHHRHPRRRHRRRRGGEPRREQGDGHHSRPRGTESVHRAPGRCRRLKAPRGAPHRAPRR